MDNNENCKSENLNGFDTAEPITETADEPIDEILETEHEAAPVQPESVHAEPVDTAAADIPIEEVIDTPKAKPQEDESISPPVASFTPSSGYGYVPNGTYRNSTSGGWQPQSEAVYINHKPDKAPKPKKEAKHVALSVSGFLAIILVVAIIGAASGIGAMFAVNGFGNNTPAPTASSPTQSGGSSTITIDDSSVESVVEAVYAKVSPSVVGIRTTVGVRNYFFGESESSGEGTGIIYTEDGYIITCFHVVENVYGSSVSSSKIEVFLPGDPKHGVEATIVGYNKSSDVALLKIDKTGLTPAEFGTSKNIREGQYVVAIGNPGGMQFMSSVSYGVISGLNRTVSVEDIGEMELIQTDAAINPGNSGGALVNTAGKVIAMNSSKYADDKYEGMGFAIPIDTVLQLVEKILSNKDVPQPYIGIEYYTNVTSEWLEENNLPAGIIVKSVTSNGPAYRAGLQSGDIIVSLNETDITDVETFTSVLAKCTPGASVAIKIYRSGKYYTGTVTIGSNNSY